MPGLIVAYHHGKLAFDHVFAVKLCREQESRGLELLKRRFPGKRVVYCCGRAGFLPTSWTAPESADEAGPLPIEEALVERSACRMQGDYTRADALRAVLEAQGFAIGDVPNGTNWHRL